MVIFPEFPRFGAAHMNPAVTLAHLQLDRISEADAISYIFAQVADASLSVLLVKLRGECKSMRCFMGG